MTIAHRAARLCLILAALALLAGAAWLILRDRNPANPPLSLSDGSEILFRGATYGTNHQFAGPGWRGIVSRLLPRKLRGNWGRGASISTPTHSLTLWFERRGARGGWLNLQYVLGSGTNFAPIHSSHSTTGGGPGGALIEGHGFASFPRREQNITLRLYDRGQGGKYWNDPHFAGEITFRNPARSTGPQWTPDPLPATKPVDDFDVMLKEVFANADWQGRRPPEAATNPARQSVFARLNFSRDGRKLGEWSSPKVELSDATGNKLTSSSWTGGWQGKDYELQFQGTLWPDEQAWKMRFELSRTTNFTSAELCTFHGIPVGATNLTNYAAFSTNLQGATVLIESVSKRPQGGRSHELFVRVRPDRPDYRLSLVAVRDDAGFALRQQGASWGSGEYKYDLNVDATARTLDVTVALHQSRYVEFLAAPKLLPLRSAKAKASN